jgi:hypothetical protein
LLLESKIQKDGNKYKGCKKEKVFVNNDFIMHGLGKGLEILIYDTFIRTSGNKTLTYDI